MLWSKNTNNQSIKTGINFGLTSAVITTFGLMVGLTTGTGLKLAVLGGILTIAIADSFSDALGIHISEESKEGSNLKQVWLATISTLLSKFIFTLTFAIPVLLFELPVAIMIGGVWALILLIAISTKIALSQNKKPLKIISEHLIIATIVIAMSYYTGIAINKFF